jgi:hypothetical protein
MERWTFLILADPSGEPSQIRLYLRAGADESTWPVVQVAVDGTEVPVDEAAKDYEAPEWKALEIFRANGGTEERWEALKNRLRGEAVDPT